MNGWAWAALLCLTAGNIGAFLLSAWWAHEASRSTRLAYLARCDSTAVVPGRLVVAPRPVRENSEVDPDALPEGFADNVRAASWPLTGNGVVWLDDTNVDSISPIMVHTDSPGDTERMRHMAQIAVHGVGELLRHHPSITPPTVVTRSAYHANRPRFDAMSPGDVMIIPDDLELIHNGHVLTYDERCVACRVITS